MDDVWKEYQEACERIGAIENELEGWFRALDEAVARRKECERLLGRNGTGATPPVDRFAEIRARYSEPPVKPPPAPLPSELPDGWRRRKGRKRGYTNDRQAIPKTLAFVDQFFTTGGKEITPGMLVREFGCSATAAEQRLYTVSKPPHNRGVYKTGPRRLERKPESPKGNVGTPAKPLVARYSVDALRRN